MWKVLTKVMVLTVLELAFAMLVGYLWAGEENLNIFIMLFYAESIFVMALGMRPWFRGEFAGRWYLMGCQVMGLSMVLSASRDYFLGSTFLGPEQLHIAIEAAMATFLAGASWLLLLTVYPSRWAPRRLVTRKRGRFVCPHNKRVSV